MSDVPYAGSEKRAGQRTLNDVEQAFDRKLREHEDREQERFKALIDKLSEEAFPDGPAKHGEYHLAKITSAKEEAEFWRAARLELAKVGVSALVGVVKAVLVLALVGFLYKLGLGAVVAGSLPK